MATLCRMHLYKYSVWVLIKLPPTKQVQTTVQIPSLRKKVWVYGGIHVWV